MSTPSFEPSVGECWVDVPGHHARIVRRTCKGVVYRHSLAPDVVRRRTLALFIALFKPCREHAP